MPHAGARSPPFHHFPSSSFYEPMKKWTALQFSSVSAIALTLWSALPSSAQENKKPRLVLQITVDQLRGDLPHRYYSEFGEGGFRYLYERGVVYEAAFYRHANNETIVGHTTLAIGFPRGPESSSPALTTTKTILLRPRIGMPSGLRLITPESHGI
jgi:hypothetical protein